MIQLWKILLSRNHYGFEPEVETTVVRLSLLIGALAGFLFGLWVG